MDTKKYNGWTNYATWRVNLEVFDGSEWPSEEYPTLHDLADAMKDYAETAIEEQSTAGIARDWAMAFLQDVNWREIAKHKLE